MSSSPNLAGGRPTAAWKQQVEGFWRWWTNELAQMVPERFAALGGASRVPHVAIEGEDLVLVEPKVSGPNPSRVAVSQDPARLRAATRSLLDRAGETRGRARLVLSPAEALVRRVTMPAATEENLMQVLSFEMDRLTPFRPEEVYFDHRVVARDSAAATIAVLVAIARRELVDARVELLRSAGITVEGVTVPDDKAHGAVLNLMPAESRGERETPRERVVKRVLLGGVALLLLAVLVYPPWIKREAIKSLHPVEARAQAEAQATNRLAQELERLAGEHNFLLAKKHGTPPVLAYIEEISRLLPDTTWVQQLELKVAGKARELQIQGETTSSSKLIEILEQSTLLRNASPRGTVTRGSQPGTERFAIVAEAKGRTPPEPVPVGQLAVPVTPAAPAAPPAAAPKAASAPAKVEVAPKADPAAATKGGPTPAPAQAAPVTAPKVDPKAAGK